jgi:ATP adenylyltransferase
MIVPKEHVSDIDKLEDETMLEMMKLCREAQKVLMKVIKPHGFNIGININRCAGAGLPDHVHMHLVPRWDGDTNFMNVTGNARVISQGLEELYNQLTETAKEMGLPKI